MVASEKCLLKGVQAVGSDEGPINSRDRIRIKVYERRTPWLRRNQKRKTRKRRRSKFLYRFQAIRRIQ
jgi:hypothetical protein